MIDLHESCTLSHVRNLLACARCGPVLGVQLPGLAVRFTIHVKVLPH